VAAATRWASGILQCSAQAVADILENWMEVPIKVHAIIEYDMNKGKTRVSPYNIACLPFNFLTEFS
jgi:hypothetical protein